MTKIIAFLSVIALTLSGTAFSKQADARIVSLLALDIPTVICTFSLKGASFDPIASGESQNLWTQRLLYSTPLKTDPNGRLASDLLTSWPYDLHARTLSFTIKEGLTFSDGSPLTITDLAYSLKRVLLIEGQKNDSALKKTIGFSQWLKQKNAFDSWPEGITVQGNTIKFHFSEHPQVTNKWATYGKYAVIPKRCINSKNVHKLTCDHPPFSGNYTLGTESSLPILTFYRRAQNQSLAEKLYVLSLKTEELAIYKSYYRENHVILADELSIPIEDLQTLSVSMRKNMTPQLRFMALNMKPYRAPFQNKRLRQFFASEYRKTVAAYLGRYDTGIFTKLMDGYIDNQSLEARVGAFSDEETKRLLALLRKTPPTYRVQDTTYSPFHFFLERMLERLDISKRPVAEERFASLGKVISGFQLDAVPSDVKDLFLPGNYDFLNHITADKKLRALLDRVDDKSLDQSNASILRDINAYLFEDSVLAVFANYSILQMTTKASPLEIRKNWTDDWSTYFIRNPLPKEARRSFWSSFGF